MKKFIAVLLSSALCTSVLCFGSTAEARENISNGWNTGGNWTVEEQGVRFSVYDFVNYQTVATFDTFSPRCYNGKDKHSPSCPVCAVYDTDFHRYCQHHYYDSYRNMYYGDLNDDVENCSKITPYLDLQYRQDIDQDKVYYATGCKLDYLYRYRGGEDLNSLAHSVIDSIPDKMEDAISSAGNYSVVDPEMFSILKSGSSPYSIPYFERLSSTTRYNAISVEGLYNEYLPISDFGKQLLSSDASVLETVLANLGFYINSDMADQGGTYFDPQQYTLVAEPVFWVGYPYEGESGRETYFYGTMTEWALFAEYKKNDTIIKKKTGSVSGADMTGGGVYSVEFGLVCVELPLSTVNHHKSIVPLGQELIIYPVSDKVRDEFFAVCPDRGYDISDGKVVKKDYITPQITSELSRIYLEYYGFDLITANDLIDLTVDIAETNTVFHPDTEALLSFYLKQSGEDPKKFCPDISDIGKEGAYGVRLNITTSDDSEIRRSDFTAAGYPADLSIICDGLPDEDDDGDGVIYNLAYAKVRLPDKTGTWKFRVTVDVITEDDISGEKLYTVRNGYSKIFSNTGKYRVTDKSIAFSVDVRSAVNGLSQPADPSAYDQKPEGFQPPDAAEYISAHGIPVTERSWTYFTAEKLRDEIFFAAHDVTVSAPDIGYPLAHTDNIPGSISAGKLQTRSGYGIAVDAQFAGEILPTEERNGATSYQSAVMLFPEDGYSQTGEKLERTEINGTAAFVHRANPYSVYYDAASQDNSRVHFTPIWYPDGEYTVIIYYFDMWTPVGTVWNVASYSADISGTVFDDWYITRNRRN